MARRPSRRDATSRYRPTDQLRGGGTPTGSTKTRGLSERPSCDTGTSPTSADALPGPSSRPATGSHPPGTASARLPLCVRRGTGGPDCGPTFGQKPRSKARRGRQWLQGETTSPRHSDLRANGRPTRRPVGALGEDQCAPQCVSTAASRDAHAVGATAPTAVTGAPRHRPAPRETGATRISRWYVRLCGQERWPLTWDFLPERALVKDLQPAEPVAIALPKRGKGSLVLHPHQLSGRTCG